MKPIEWRNKLRSKSKDAGAHFEPPGPAVPEYLKRVCVCVCSSKFEWNVLSFVKEVAQEG